jgi:hypothetical protein
MRDHTEYYLHILDLMNVKDLLQERATLACRGRSFRQNLLTTTAVIRQSAPLDK